MLEQMKRFNYLLKRSPEEIEDMEKNCFCDFPRHGETKAVKRLDVKMMDGLAENERTGMILKAGCI